MPIDANGYYTGACVRPALVLCCPVIVSLNDINFVQYKNVKWASAQRKFAQRKFTNLHIIYFCAAKREHLILSVISS